MRLLDVCLLLHQMFDKKWIRRGVELKVESGEEGYLEAQYSTLNSPTCY